MVPFSFHKNIHRHLLATPAPPVMFLFSWPFRLTSLNNQQPARHSGYSTADGLGYAPHPPWFLTIHSYINFFVELFSPMDPQIIISFLYFVPLLLCSSYPPERRSFCRSYASLMWKDSRLHYSDFQKETSAFMSKDTTYKGDLTTARWLSLHLSQSSVLAQLGSSWLSECWIKASCSTGKRGN